MNVVAAARISWLLEPPASGACVHRVAGRIHHRAVSHIKHGLANITPGDMHHPAIILDARGQRNVAFAKLGKVNAFHRSAGLLEFESGGRLKVMSHDDQVATLSPPPCRTLRPINLRQERRADWLPRA